MTTTTAGGRACVSFHVCFWWCFSVIWFFLFLGDVLFVTLYIREVKRERTHASERDVERNLGRVWTKAWRPSRRAKDPAPTLRRRSRGCDEGNAGGEIPLFWFLRQNSASGGGEKVLPCGRRLKISAIEDRFFFGFFVFPFPPCSYLLSSHHTILSAPSLFVIT